MFFSKIVVSAVAVLTAATGVFASPVASPEPLTDIVKRGGSPTDVCQHAYTSCQPYIGQISMCKLFKLRLRSLSTAPSTAPTASLANVEVAIDAIAVIFADLGAAINVFAVADVVVEINAIVAIYVKLLVVSHFQCLYLTQIPTTTFVQALFAAVNSCGSVTAEIIAKLDLFIKVHLALLAKISVDICGKIIVGCVLRYSINSPSLTQVCYPVFPSTSGSSSS